jgi:hypothetical protein
MVNPLLISHSFLQRPAQAVRASLPLLPVVGAHAGVGGGTDIAQVFLVLLQKCRYTPECKISTSMVSIEQNRLTVGSSRRCPNAG